MSLLSAQGLSFEFQSDAVLFRGVTFSIHPGDRIGLLGPNGSGKSTLLRLLDDTSLPLGSGSIARSRQLICAHAEQELAAEDRGQTLFEYVLSASPEIAAVRAALQVASLEAAASYAQMVCDYHAAGGYLAEAEVARLLAGLDFPDEADWERQVHTLSGGEWSRAQLARTLAVRDANLLLLDEPTNHLDRNVRRWLAAELAARRDKCACVAASHDRAFLEEFATRIFEIERGTFTVYEGGYALYREMKELRSGQEWAEYEAFERRKSAMEAAAMKRDKLAVKVATAPPGARHSKDFYARKASKVARTGRILREEQPIDHLSFENMTRSSDVVVVAEDVGKAFGRVLFSGLSFYLRRGERMLITGANGSGKTTLLNMVAGSEPVSSGSIRLGANVVIGSVAQMLDRQFDYAKSPLELCGTGTDARTLLACLKVPVICLNRPLHSLSGGERTKVALAAILNSRANLLLLDEPTNHLEIEAREALEQALQLYPGAVIAVSHDDAFRTAFCEDERTAVLDLDRPPAGLSYGMSLTASKLTPELGPTA
jgi:ATP-binding cassette, subfamily F, member 3